MKFAGLSADVLTVLASIAGNAIGYILVLGLVAIFGKNFLYVPLFLGPFFMIWAFAAYDYNEKPIDTILVNNAVNIGFFYLYYRKFVELSAKNSKQSGGRKLR